jgi:hypothetical protein
VHQSGFAVDVQCRALQQPQGFAEPDAADQAVVHAGDRPAAGAADLHDAQRRVQRLELADEFRPVFERPAFHRLAGTHVCAGVEAIVKRDPLPARAGEAQA